MIPILEQNLKNVKFFSKYSNKEVQILIYSKVIQYCSDNNLSISAFEKLCSIGNGTIGRWNPELEKPSKPDLDSLEKISKVTVITVAELVSGR